MSKLVIKCDDQSKMIKEFSIGEHAIHSKPESFDSIASSLVSGLQDGLTHGSVDVQAAINDAIKKIPKEMFEFVGRIDGPPLTKLRKL